MNELRTLALILDVGRKRADSMGDPVMAAVLSDMVEAAVGYHAARTYPGSTAQAIWDLNADWLALYKRIYGDGSVATHACPRCGSTQWVGWRSGPDPDLPRYAQCVPCGKIGDRVGPGEEPLR